MGVKKAMSSITLCSYDRWLDGAERTHSTGLKPQEFRTSNYGTVRIRPLVSEHIDLTVLAADWLPVQRDGRTTFEWMVHTPSQFPEKSRSLQWKKSEWVSKQTEKLTVLDNVVLVGGTPNYYHWLIDYLPRLLIANSMVNFEGWRFLLNADLGRHQIESLSLLKIKEDARLFLMPWQSLQATRVAIPSLLSTTTLCHPAVPQMLKQAFPPRNISPRKRIYLSREDATSRRLTNEVELMIILENFGFEKIIASNMTFQDQIDIFFSADVIVAAHGAGMTNMIFCKQSAKIFEISCGNYRVSSMRFLAAICNLSHRFIDAVLSTQRNPNPLLNDWEVNLVQIKEVLAKF